MNPDRGTAGSRLLRCNPAGLDIGSDRSECYFTISNPLSVAGPEVDDEGEHFHAFRAGAGSGGSAAGRQRQSSTYPQALLVNLPRRAIAEALVLALHVVKT